MAAQTQGASADVMAVLGAGSWGTALAIQVARSGKPVRLWGRDAAHLATLEHDRCNRRYLPDARFPDSLHTEPDLAAAIADSQDVLIVVPSQALRSVLERLRPVLRRGMGLAWATKGLEQESGKLPHQVVREAAPVRKEHLADEAPGGVPSDDPHRDGLLEREAADKLARPFGAAPALRRALDREHAHDDH